MRVILFFAMLFATASYSQSNLWLSATADATGHNLGSIPITSAVIYFPTTHWGIGASGCWKKDATASYSNLSALVRYYPCRQGFIQASLGNDINTNKVIYGALLGYTAPIGKVFYVEPGIKYSRTDEENYLGVSVGLGLKL